MFNISGAKEWHENGYKGKGIRVLVVEPDPKAYHAKSVVEIVKMHAPDSTILMYDYENYKEEAMIEYAIANHVHIINTSYGMGYPDGTYIETRARNAYKKALDKGILLVNSAGNEGEGTIKDNGLLDDRIINVGMVTKELEIPIESSYGNGEVDCGGLVGHKLSDGTILWGTSESAPYVSGLLAVLLSKEKLTYKQVMSFIGKHSITIDERIGAGFFRLPSFINPLSVEMTRPDGKQTFIHKDYVVDKLKQGYTV